MPLRPGRPQRWGSLFVDPSIPSLLLHSLSFYAYLQLVAVQLCFPKSRAVQIVVIYRSPSCLRSNFSDCLEWLADFINSSHNDTIVMGDFNCPALIGLIHLSLPSTTPCRFYCFYQPDSAYYTGNPK